LNAVRNNRAATLKEILAIVRRKYKGEVVRVSLRGNGPNLTYRIKLLDEDNRLIEVLVNAVSRRIVRAKGT
ncbi:MAG: PepSY domain-containing protein, partial [Hyphomicrobiales bacterium]|nr:PepSY domain-containing protein [Hyphomicrobiales bacterium]